MSAQQIFRLRNPALLMALAAAFPVISYAAGAANVDFAAGSVMAVNAVGVQRPLSKGAEIGNGDTIRTGDGGRAQVRFSDGALVSLQPQTEFRIDNYQFSGKADESDKGFFSLLKGGLRTITGLVGRSSRDNYKVTTSVATIGIRGTEYSAGLNTSGDELNVATGEGLVEVCNDAGCILLASGESGLVQGSGQPRRYSSRPRLPPASIPQDLQPVFSSSDQRPEPSPPPPPPPTLPPTPPPTLPPPLISGPNYAVAFAGKVSGGPDTDVVSPVNATFNAANALTSFTDGSNTYSASVIAGAFSSDGVIGWGRWASGTTTSGSLIDFHYVTGIPTPTADLAALGGITATYNLIGFTFPTAQDGTVGQAPSGTLTANFGGGVSNSTVSLNLTVPIGGQTFSIVGGTSWASASMPQTFSFNTGGSASASAAVNGFFTGANASHAGIAYKIDSGASLGGSVFGVGAFKR
ncbi:MAG: FecR domain-containing protein [Propionivibrio sp.]|uniref:FecR family protein n=1 Tax=Propionivibrio sp. TaxID=2212460 RepID=UPI001A5EA636|nr:FecR family protein [Propionivibrio sp.]MBL8415462.1 FecR domain-containing protein [Propionivibrio sp.]